MTLTTEERDSLVEYRMRRAYQALNEAVQNSILQLWNVTANRLYYACYYASAALLIQNGYAARSHGGTIQMIGKFLIENNYQERVNIKTIQKLFQMRQSGDYDDFFDNDKDDVLPYIPKAEEYIQAIEKVINEIN